MRSILLLATVAVVALSGCGSRGPTNPATDVPVAIVAVTPASLRLQVGATRQFTAQPRDADGNALNRTISWQTSAASVATVSSTGLVTAIAPGTARITATSSGRSGSAEITVPEPTISVASVFLIPTTTELELGEARQITATVKDSNGNTLTGRLVTWTSSSQAVATVSVSGLVTAISPGTTTVTATSEGISAAVTITVAAPPPLPMVDNGYYHSCALTPDGTAWCWGRNDAGQVGAGIVGGPVLVPTRVSTDFRFKDIAVSWSSTCAITMAGKAWCWGLNDWGALGDGTWSSSAAPVAVSGDHTFTSITAGDDAVCGLTAAATMICWGDGDWGQFGNGTEITSNVPLTGGTGHQWLQVEMGTQHTCGLTVAGAAWCWGRGEEGELGTGVNVPQSTVPVAVTGGHTFVEISAGEGHTCGRTAAGVVWCWGWNGKGQLGNNTFVNSPAPVRVQGNDQFRSITAQGWTTCGLLISGTAKCWGYNEDGAIGNNSTTDMSLPTPVAGNNLFRTLSTGLGYVNCGFRVDGRLLCWGWNHYGQLGTGDTIDNLVPVVLPQMQDAGSVLTPGAVKTSSTHTIPTGRRSMPTW